MPKNTPIGFQGKLSRNTGTFGSPTWNEIENCKDVVINQTMNEAESTTRESGGLETVEPSTEVVSIEWSMVNDKEDADLTALVDAYYARQAIEICLHDGPMTGSGSTGTKFTRLTVKVFEAGEDQNNKNVQMRKIVVKPCRSDNARVRGTVS